MPKFTLALFVTLVFMAIGMGSGFVIAHELRKGRILTRENISRAKDPFEFWISILLTAIFGGAFLAVGISLLLKSL